MPIQIDSHRQLFLDDYLVERIDRLERTFHQPEKRGPVLKAEKPLEGVYCATFSPPMWIPDEGVFKQVYEYRYQGNKGKSGHNYALALSKDGVRWENPNLGLVEFDGSKQNNLFPTPDGRRLVHVVYDPDDPDPAQRYKGLLTVPKGRVPVVSADCLHWEKLGTHLPSGDAGTMTFDRENRLFMAMLKRPNQKTVGRSYDVSFSSDFVEWSEPRFIFGMDKELDQEMAVDTIRRRLSNPAFARPLFTDPDPETGWRHPKSAQHTPTWQCECYNFGVVPYEGLYLGLITVYYPTGQHLPDRTNADGFNLIQLAMSRDLKEWKRLGERQPFLGPSPLTEGLAGNYDRLQLGAYNGIIQHEDEIRFYYNGMKRRVPQHDRWTDGSPRPVSTLSDSERADWREDTHSATCLSVLRRDGFISLDAGEDGGELITKPFITTGDQLRLNVDVRHGGHARAEVLGHDLQPANGLSLEQCDALRDGTENHVVSWQSSADLSQLTGKPIRLRIELKDASLYSFQFTAS